jgi:hypothetical protein
MLALAIFARARIALQCIAAPKVAFCIITPELLTASGRLLLGKPHRQCFPPSKRRHRTLLSFSLPNTGAGPNPEIIAAMFPVQPFQREPLPLASHPRRHASSE